MPKRYMLTDEAEEFLRKVAAKLCDLLDPITRSFARRF